MKTDVYDFIGIGLGPFNLSLACLAEPIEELSGVFLERNAEFCWHPGMLIDHTTLQNPFLADLVSLADPCSRYSFLNYCKAQGNIYSYYFRESFYLTRAEFNEYCRWAAAQLSNVRFGHEVRDIVYDAQLACYVLRGVSTTGDGEVPFVLRARKLVLGVGSRPAFPACCQEGGKDSGHRYCHSADYLLAKESLQRKRSITILGSGQSAAEIFHDLLAEIDAHDYSLTWITRAPRFFQMETTKLTLEMFSPDYIDYFHALDETRKERVVGAQDCLYKGVNASLINRIYDMLDERRLAEQRGQGTQRARLVTNCEMQGCRYDAASDSYEVDLRQLDQGGRYRHRCEGLVLATGYRENIPPFLDGIRHRLRFDGKGRYALARNYSADLQGNEVFVQNAGQHSHGATNQDLGMSCYRNSYILRELTGVEHYRIEQRVALQDFAIPAGADFVPM
ncbi:SidA/IucD/PvdA family monooxygenase [Massilia sp. METH4]|uniref:lysine N(6)-hydroxylase/L-ornithine N(5)-oxygenase family protein n=1 Tax=Massilia sp. METH4 TaxID=3123041 RepID=UPI0030CBA1DE